MKEELNYLLTDKGNKYGVYISIGLILIGLIVFFLRMPKLPPLLPFFYNRPWGTAQLGEPLALLFLLIASTVVFIVNMALATKLYKSVALLARMLIWVATLVSLLATTTVVRVIFLIS